MFIKSFIKICLKFQEIRDFKFEGIVIMTSHTHIYTSFALLWWILDQEEKRLRIWGWCDEMMKRWNDEMYRIQTEVPIYNLQCIVWVFFQYFFFWGWTLPCITIFWMNGEYRKRERESWKRISMCYSVGISIFSFPLDVGFSIYLALIDFPCLLFLWGNFFLGTF